MRAVVLVGGFGTRLRPLTWSTPKQMLTVVHRPMIEHVLEHLARHGIDDAVLSLGYRPDVFTAAYPDAMCAGVRLHYAVEPEPLDTAGAIRFAALDAGIDERFVVVNGDVITDLDVTGLVRFHEEHGAEGTIALHRVDDPSRYGVVPTEADGRVIEFVEKPPREEAPTDLINAGTYVLEPSVLDRIAGDRKVSIEREVFPAMAADGTLYATDGDTYWIDTGTPNTYLQVQLDLLDGELHEDRGPAPEGVHPTAMVEPGARVHRSVVGPGAIVHDGAVLDDAVVLDNAVIGGGAVVRCSVVGPGAKIGDGAVIEDHTVVGDDESVDPGEHLVNVKRPDGQPT